MFETTDYIEAYFKQTLNEQEKHAFEAKCSNDESFAKEVAFYVTTQQTLRDLLLEQKTNAWKQEKTARSEEAPVIAINKKTSFGKWIMYTAAACLILAVSVYLFEAQSSPKRIASNYIQANYNNLSHTMDASQDSMQLGISAYNDKDYDKALQLFTGIQKNDPQNSDAKKYAGLTYLQQQDFDKAIAQFDALAGMKNLFSNSGDFLKAVSLMQRNKPGDKEMAQKLLQKVVNENEEGHEEAEEWLKKF